MRNAAITDGHAGPNQLRDANARKDLRILLRNGSREGSRSGHADLGHRADGNWQVEPCSLIQQINAVVGETKRADRFEERISDGVFLGIRFTPGQGDENLDQVMRGSAVVKPESDGLCGMAQHRRGDFHHSR